MYFSTNFKCTGEDDAPNIKKETATLAAKFHPVGLALGLPPSELDKIGRNCPRDCDEAFFQVITAWLRQSYNVNMHGHPSWKKLVEAVASGGQNPALARKVAAAHRGKDINNSLSL
jgi:hypothetical protein